MISITSDSPMRPMSRILRRVPGDVDLSDVALADVGQQLGQRDAAPEHGPFAADDAFHLPRSDAALQLARPVGGVDQAGVPVTVALAVGLAGEYPQLWIHQRERTAKPRRRDRHQPIQALGDAGDERCIPPPRLLRSEEHTSGTPVTLKSRMP